MGLKGKTTAILALLLGVLLVADYLVVDRIVLPNFTAIEHEGAIDDLERATNAIGNEAASLGLVVSDWAAWDDTYEWMRTGEAEYVETNLAPSTFIDNDIGLIFFYDADGKPVWGKAYDLETGKETALEEFPAGAPPAFADLLAHEHETSTITGLAETSAGLVLLASAPVVTSENAGPIRGTMVMGRPFDAVKIEEISRKVRVPLRAWTLSDPALPPPARTAVRRLPGEGSAWVDTASETALHAYGVIAGISGESVLLLRAEKPREINAIAKRTADFALWALFAAGIVVIAAMGVFTYFVVIRPLTRRAGPAPPPEA